MKPGEVIGNYELLELAGSGAMGEVFRARQISMSRIVALKILSERFAEDGSFVDRFVREARSAGKCNHANLIQVYDVGHLGGVYYFSMEFVGGPTLKEVLDEKGPLPETEAVAHMIKIAGALGQAHSRGIVHRDVKPANIILTEQGDPKLADLGLAKPLEAGAEETNTDKPLGTPYYMCPEQVRGDRLDGRADLYALGATFFHLLAGETLFSASTPAAVMAKHLTDPPRPLREVRRDCSRGLEAVVMKLLAKDPGYRYQDAEELIWDLNAVAGGRRPRHAKLLLDTGRQRPVSTRRSAAIRKASPARGARTGPWVAAGVIPAAAVAALILLFSRGGEDVGPEPPEPEKESSDSPGKPAAPKPAPKEDRNGRLAEEFRRAESFAAKHPEDYEGAIRAFGAIVAAGRGGAFEKKAKARTAELRSAWKRAARAALREVLAGDASVSVYRALRSGDYDAALDRLKAFATGAGTRKLASQVGGEIEEETRRIRRAGMAKIDEILVAAEAQLEAGGPRVARKILAAMSGVRYAEGRAAVAERVARLTGRIDAFGKEKPARRGGPAPQVPGESEESARRRLADILSEFEAHVKAGLYGEARTLVERAASKVTGDLGGTLRAASRVARAMEARQAAIRRRLGAMAARGGEVALETAKGVRRGEITGITADGIELTAKIMSGRQVIGRTKLSVRWSELSLEQEDRLARGWKPEGGVRPNVESNDGHMALAVLAICREDEARAAQALDAAGGHPLAGYFRERLEELGAGPAEAAARLAWRRIEERAGAKSLPAARAKALLGDIAAFEKKHGGTEFAASVGDRVAAAKARAQGGMATVTGLVGHWRFDEGRGETAADSSGGGHHGTINGATWVRGRIGNALRFDGADDYVEVPPSATSGLKVFTFSLWVNTTESRTRRAPWRRPCLFGQVTGGGGSGDLTINSSNGYIGFFHGLHAGDQQYLSTTTKIGDGTWHHVAVTADASSVKLYVDGRHEASLPRAGRPSSGLNDAAFRMGAAGGNDRGVSHHSGTIDDVRVYDRALREEDIRSLSGARPPLAESAVPLEEEEGGAESGSPEGLAGVLGEFEARIKAGLYGEARALVERAATGAGDAAGETLRAAGRVADVLSQRRAEVRRALKALADGGGEVVLETANGTRKGRITEITAEGIELAAKIMSGRQVVGQTKLSVRWSDLSPKQEDRLARGWKPEGDVKPSDGHMARAILAICREDAVRAAQAFEAAGDHPLAGHFRERLEELKVGPAEAAARLAWRRIEEKAGAKSLPVARARALLGDIAAFEKKHGGTKFAASVADRAAAAKARAQGAMAAVTGLVGHWRFDEGRGEMAADSSGGGHHGTINGATWVRGRIGNALRFDGATSEVVVTGPDGYDLGTADFAIAAWIRTDRDGIFLTKSPANDSWQRGGKMFFVRGGRLQFDAHSVGVVRSRPTVADGEWHHVACTFENESKMLRLYVDGAAHGERQFRLGPDVPGHLLRIGFGPRRSPGRGSFEGDIDDVRIYNRVLREEDIRSLSGARSAAGAVR